MEAISVIIPTYNRGKTIRRAVESVLAQSYPVREVIIVDDCSQDDTEAVLQQIRDPRMGFYRLPENRGAGGARNYGVEKARYDLIAFHDSDDVWNLEKIEKQMRYWQKRPEYGLIYTAYTVQCSDHACRVIPNISAKRKLEGDILPELLFQNTVGAPTVLMKKQIYEEVGGFDETMRSLEDWDFAIKVAKKYSIGFVEESLLEVELSDGGVSSNPAAYYQNRCYILGKHLQEYLETDMLKASVQNILASAERDNVLPQVAKMLQLYLPG